MSTNEWDDYAAGWDDNVAVKAYANAAHQALKERAVQMQRSLKGAQILDFGCGTGLLVEAVQEDALGVHGVDTSTSMLEVLSQKIQRRGWQNVSTSERLPEGQKYDFVLCSSVCAFVEDYVGTVKKLVALLNPGGVFVQWDWERNSDDEDPSGLSQEEIQAALLQAGLDDIVVQPSFELVMGDKAVRPLMGSGRWMTHTCSLTN